MAYNPKNLSALAYANGFTLWHTVSGRGEAHATEQARLDGALDLQAKQDSVATQAAVERIGKT
jgi:hypothetical protein